VVESIDDVILLSGLRPCDHVRLDAISVGGRYDTSDSLTLCVHQRRSHIAGTWCLRRRIHSLALYVSHRVFEDGFARPVSNPACNIRNELFRITSPTRKIAVFVCMSFAWWQVYVGTSHCKWSLPFRLFLLLSKT